MKIYGILIIKFLNDLFEVLWQKQQFDFTIGHQKLTWCLFHAEDERRKKEEAERKAKLDEIAEKQRQRERELEEKERLRREALLGRSTEAFSNPSEPPAGTRPSEPPAAVAVTAANNDGAAAPPPSTGKYVPRFLRLQKQEGSAQAPPPEPDRWTSRQDSRRSPPPGDRWRSGDDRRPTFGSGSRSTWSSSRPRGSERWYDQTVRTWGLWLFFP